MASRYHDTILITKQSISVLSLSQYLKSRAPCTSYKGSRLLTSDTYHSFITSQKKGKLCSVDLFDSIQCSFTEGWSIRSNTMFHLRHNWSTCSVQCFVSDAVDPWDSIYHLPFRHSCSISESDPFGSINWFITDTVDQFVQFTTLFQKQLIHSIQFIAPFQTKLINLFISLFYFRHSWSVRFISMIFFKHSRSICSIQCSLSDTVDLFVHFNVLFQKQLIHRIQFIVFLRTMCSFQCSISEIVDMFNSFQ